MAYNRNHARQLLNDSEHALFESSLAENIGRLSRSDLNKKIERTRKLRDKYTDLFRRQSLTTRDRTGSKRGQSGVANERTQQKATMLGEVLTRFENQLAKLDRAKARESKRVALERARKARGSSGRTTPKKAERATAKKAGSKGVKQDGTKDFMSEGASAARNKDKIASPRNQAITAHVGARGRRSQAKRDSR